MKNIIIIFILCICFFACNKTGIKGKIIYAPTNESIEDIEVSIIPKLQTEERNDLIKEVETDENGEFKVSGLENKYSYYVTITDPKYKEVKSPILISSLVEDQTKLINPVEIIDILPGDKSYVKRKDGKFEELTQMDSYHLRHFSTYSWVNMRYVFMNDVKSYNPMKVKNGEIIYNGATNHKTYLYPITKCTYDASLYDNLKNNNLIDLDYVGNYHFKKDHYLGYVIKENFQHKLEGFYFQVHLPKGYYIYSHGQNIHMNDKSFIPYVFEVVDDPSEEFVNE